MPKAKDEQKIEAIHSAAMHMVLQTGFGALKMADVAVKAGIATGTLYVYYQSKEELINTLYFKTKAEIIQVLLSPKHATNDFYETFTNMWTAYFTYCLQHPHKMLFVEQFVYSGMIEKDIMEQTENLLLPLDQFLHFGMENRVLKKISVALMKAHIQGSIHELVKTLTREQRNPTIDEINQCLAITWQGIKR
jgi:AcrR family transcriptional regulator